MGKYELHTGGMFLQQTCGSVGRVLPAVLAPLIILELHADPSWVGVYFGLTAIAALIAARVGTSAGVAGRVADRRVPAGAPQPRRVPPPCAGA